MKDRPIIFSGSSLPAIHRGLKRMTRRLLTPELVRFFDGQGSSWRPSQEQLGAALTDARDFRCIQGDTWTWTAKALPHQCSERTHWMAHLAYAPGDLLWVREAWRTDPARDLVKPSEIPPGAPVLYEWDDPERTNNLGLWGKLRTPIYMPRWASRTTLRVTATKIERLQDISDDDAYAEGTCAFVEANDHTPWGELSPVHRTMIVLNHYGSVKKAFSHYWMTIHSEKSWDANPWVVPIGFEVLQANIDQLPAAATAQNA
jgi:hypothetical protein